MTDGSLSIAFRYYFSGVHLGAAALFARHSYLLEETKRTQTQEQVINDHRAYVLGAVLHSAAFLEAVVNEFFSDAGDSTDSAAVRSLLDSERQLLAEMWEQGVPRTAQYPIIKKFEIVLSLLRRSAFDKSTNPYSDARVLTELRNALIHYEPEWVPGGTHRAQDQKSAHKFEKALRGRFDLNPFSGSGSTFYPSRMLGHGCAQWAVNTALGFADCFFQLIGTPPPYEHHRARFATIPS
jgi:hypothetical protein